MTSHEEKLLSIYNEKYVSFEGFKNLVTHHFLASSELSQGSFLIIHSVKSRMKSTNGLIDKIRRKNKDSLVVTEENFFNQITDFCGVRVIHLYQNDFPKIHRFIMKLVDEGEWFLNEQVKAYTWDPETKPVFDKLSINTEQKDSLYTSVHYVIRSREGMFTSCEIQVRTLFDEIWGEVDHKINYPHPCESISCQEQLKVLAKLSSTGTRLLDSVNRTFTEFNRQEP